MQFYVIPQDEMTMLYAKCVFSEEFNGNTGKRIKLVLICGMSVVADLVQVSCKFINDKFQGPEVVC